MDEWKTLLSCLPEPGDIRIDWDAVCSTAYASFAQQMAETKQNPVWHGEGDVWCHTRMVCETLVAMDEYQAQPVEMQKALLVAALLHDIGKIPCTIWEDGAWTSPNHAIVGAKMARRWLWEVCGLYGTPEKLRMRELICLLVRYHMLPGRVTEQSNAEKRLVQMASCGALVPDFTLHRLCILAMADTRGRIADDLEASANTTQKCAEAAEHLGCLHGPGQNGVRNMSDIVPMLCRLPGTDTAPWLACRLAHVPVISLPQLAQEEIPALPLQSRKLQRIAAARCRDHLRQKKPFMLDAAHLSQEGRKQLVRSLQGLQANARIIYLEDRHPLQPEEAELLSSFTPPEPGEAPLVEWLCMNDH
ncbi:MAG: HD domain-containing protein [Clostridiales bacterium]|nr:HD domain-containing protein [Clostridiales bacterium]